MLMYLTIIDSKEGQQKFEFIYNRYKKLMFYIANKILGDTRDSEDTVHDAFLKIIEIIDDIKDVESPQTRSFLLLQHRSRMMFLLRRLGTLVPSTLMQPLLPPTRFLKKSLSKESLVTSLLLAISSLRLLHQKRSNL